VAKVKIEAKGNVAILRLDNGVKNPVGYELVEDMSAALRTLKNECDGMVLAGGDKFFCIGLNLPELIHYNRSEMTEFWYKFNQVTLDLYTLPLPTACAIVGHAPAVGTIWALCCDLRIAAGGQKLFGLLEVKLGVPTPFLTDLMLRQTVSDHIANDVLYFGELFNPDKAKEINLIHEICPEVEVEEKALSYITALTARPRHALAAIKAVRTEDIRLNYERNFKIQNEIFLDCWFNDSTRQLLAKAAEKF
jgi:enoyl-CoA hydratase/carnithine racemase